MVGQQEQRRRIGEGRIFGEPSRIGMTMRAQDGQIANLGEDPPRDFADLGVGREESVWMKQRHSITLTTHLKQNLSGSLAIAPIGLHLHVPADSRRKHAQNEQEDVYSIHNVGF
jgi:hypothetical protein